MKKFLFTMLLAITGCITAMAGSDFELREGSFASLKDGGTAVVTINMTDTKFDNKMPLREDGRFANVDELIPGYLSEFIKEFNKRSKKMSAVSSGDAQYTIDINITNLDVYVKVWPITIPATKLWGTATVINNSTGEKVVVADITELEGMGGTYAISTESALENIAEELAKHIKKGK